MVNSLSRNGFLKNFGLTGAAGQVGSVKWCHYEVVIDSEVGGCEAPYLQVVGTESQGTDKDVS